MSAKPDDTLSKFKTRPKERRRRYNLVMLMIFAVAIAIIVSLIFALILEAQMIRVDVIENQIANMQTEITQIQGQAAQGAGGGQTNGDTVTDYTKTLDFINVEIQRYREFIQQEQSYLIWLVGLIGILGASVFGFFGFKRKKDVEEFLKREYREEFNRQLADALGDDEPLKYLSEAVRREKKAKAIPILFAATEGEDIREMEETRRAFHNTGYFVSDKVFLLDQENMEEMIEKYRIIAFQVPEREFEKNRDSSEDTPVLYNNVVRICGNAMKHCVLFAQDDINTLIRKKKYVTIANFSTKLRETLYALLSLPN